MKILLQSIIINKSYIMKKFCNLAFFTFCVWFVSCEYNIETQIEYNNFLGRWTAVFDWNVNEKDLVAYTLQSDGNVNCVGMNCAENITGSTLVSRTWTSTGDNVVITLKYLENNNNNRLVTGLISGRQYSRDQISGTLSYSNGNSGTWTAVRDTTVNSNETIFLKKKYSITVF